MKAFPLKRVRASAKKFDAGWEKGSAPFEYWAPYLEAAYVEGARVGFSLAKEESARDEGDAITTEEKRSLNTIEECHAYVSELCGKVQRLIQSEISKLHPHQRYLITARVINVLFASTFMPIPRETERAIERAEAQREMNS